MEVLKIYSATVSGSDLVLWNKSRVLLTQEKIGNFLKAKLGDEYSRFLAIPTLKDKGSNQIEITWWIKNTKNSEIDLVTGNMPEDFTNKFNRINLLINSLKNDSDSTEWANLLSAVFDNKSLFKVFSVGDSYTIALWGIKDSARLPEAPNDSSVSAKSTKLPIADTNERWTEDFLTAGSNEISQVDKDSSRPEETFVAEKTLEKEKPDVNANETVQDESVNTYMEIDDRSGAFLDSPEALKPENSDSGKKRKMLKLLFLLLLIPLVILLIRQCVSSGSGLPKNPGAIIPVDSSTIEMDKDSIGFIAGDRLNILSQNEGISVNDLMKKVQELFPDKETYSIIYFDTVTNRIQVSIPPKEKESFKKKLEQQLKEYKVLIWEERMYKNNFRPADPAYNNPDYRWHLDAIKVSGAWDKTLGSNKVIIAVLDDGFDLSHPELKDRVFRPYNAVERSQNVFTQKNSIHGTHVAGLAVARDNNIGLVGVSPHCKFMPIQVADRRGNISSTAVIDGILYALSNGANVINISLGESFNPLLKFLPVGIQRDIVKNSRLNEEVFWKRLFRMTDKANAVVVVAAGNQDIMVGIDPMQRAANVIKVNALNPDLSKASFSNFGELSTLSAPGVDIYSTIPMRRFKTLNGTSMAAPIVAGAVALFKSLDKSLSSLQIINILQKSGLKINSGNRYIGNLIQLDQAINYYKSGNVASSECFCVQNIIDSLNKVIEMLKLKCIVQDTLKLPPNTNGTAFLEGRWKSTTPLHNDQGKEVNILFDFDTKNQGRLTLLEPGGEQCKADLSLNFTGGLLSIKQLQNAVCSDKNRYYQAYTFSCSADASGYASCQAQNIYVRSNNFKFKLIKVNHYGNI